MGYKLDESALIKLANKKKAARNRLESLWRNMEIVCVKDSINVDVEMLWGTISDVSKTEYMSVRIDSDDDKNFYLMLLDLAKNAIVLMKDRSKERLLVNYAIRLNKFDELVIAKEKIETMIKNISLAFG